MDKLSTLTKQLAALLEGEEDLIAAMANASAAIFDAVPELNWAGFYREKDGVLVLGPFQGKVACARIAFGRGVCGTAWKEDAPQLVPDVHLFPGHIACDSASNSELVVPIHGSDGRFIGVIDLDSPKTGRFTERELEAFCEIARLFGKY